jgi:hypothetical protein
MSDIQAVNINVANLVSTQAGSTLNINLRRQSSVDVNRVGALGLGGRTVLAVIQSDVDQTTADLTLSVANTAEASSALAAANSNSNSTTASAVVFLWDKNAIQTTQFSTGNFSADATSVTLTINPTAPNGQVWDFTRIAGIVFPAIAMRPSKVLLMSQNTIRCVFDNPAVAPNSNAAASIVLAYNSLASYNIVYEDVTTTFYAKVAGLVDAAIAKSPATFATINANTISGITQMAQTIAVQAILQGYAGTTFDVTSTVGMTAVNLMKNVVLEIIITKRAAAAGASVDGSYTAKTANCGVNQCSDRIAQVFKTNDSAKSNIAAYNRDISALIGDYVSNTGIATQIASKSEAYKSQNRVTGEAVTNVVSQCKAVYIRILLYSGAVLLGCILNLVVSFFIQSDTKFSRFLAVFFMFVYVCAFAVVIVLGSTTRDK